MKKKILIGTVIVTLTVVFSLVSILGKDSTTTVFKKTDGPDVRSAKIEKGSISSIISADGTVSEVEKAEIYFDTPLRVVDILVEKNQHVSKGEKLIELDISSLYSELDKLEINKNIQQLNLEMAQMQDELKKAEIALENAGRTYEKSTETYNENKLLYESGAISEAELKMSKKNCDDAQSAYESSKINLDMIKKSMNYDRKIKEETLQSTVLTINDLQESINRIENNVLCPIDGIVSEINVVKGGHTGGLPVFEIINTDQLKINAYIKEYNSGRVKVGQKVTIWGDAISKNDNIEGRVESISPKAESKMSSGGEETIVEAVISLEKTYPVLRPGLSVTCDISTENIEDALIIPLEAVIPDKDSTQYVYTIDAQTGILTKTYIELGIIADMHAQVDGGLNEGELVVLDPQPFFQDGMTVNIIKEKE